MGTLKGLRQGLGLVIAVELALVIVGIVLYMAINRALDAVDAQEVRADALRVERTFLEFHPFLASKAQDWSTWDEAYAYVTHRDESFATANLTPATVGNLKVSLIAYLDKDLKLISARRYDPETKTLTEIDPGKAPFLSPESPLIQASGKTVAFGFSSLDGRPAFIAARAVVDGAGATRPLGRLVLARAIDAEVLASVKQQTLFDVRLAPASEHAPEASTGHGTQAGKPDIALSFKDDTATASVLLRDLEGAPLAAIRAEIPREVALHGRAAAKGIVAIYVLLMAVIFVAMQLFLNFTGIKRGLSQLSLAHKRISESEAQLKALVDAIPGYVSWFDASLRYLGVNKRMSESFGLPANVFEGKEVGFKRQDEEPPLKTTLEAFMGSREASHETTMIVREGDGESHYLLRLQKYQDGQRVVVVGLDVTAQWRLEEQIQRDRQAAIHASRLSSLGEMAAGIAHEINSPLTIIEGASLRLQAHLEQSGVEGKPHELIGTITRTTSRIARIVSGLLTFARDGSRDARTPTALSGILDDTLALCAERFKSPDIMLRTPKEDLGITLECRPVQIGQVLVNLLNNAFDAVAELENRWVEITVAQFERHVEIAVTDSGPGISPELAEKIMTPFFTTKSPNKGTGLGLSIAQSIVAEHGGSLKLDTSSKRTRFVMELPL